MIRLACWIEALSCKPSFASTLTVNEVIRGPINLIVNSDGRRYRRPNEAS